jgi:quaternary ammonium compound-resistance protein SugE
MSWTYLVIAGILEVIFAYVMKQSEGFTRLIPSALTLLTGMGSFWLLSLAMRTIPMGTAYIIWTGIGAVGAFITGIVFLGETMTNLRAIAAMFIVIGLILMKLASH